MASDKLLKKCKGYCICVTIGLAFSYSFAQSQTSGNFSTEINYKRQLGFALYRPENLSSKKPLIIFLHGDGEKGTDVEKVKIHGPLKYLKTHQLDAFVLAPQCRENELWDTEAIYKLILKIQKENNIDPDRIYLTGLSSGGWATWNVALAHPEMFAAIVPISSFVDLIQMDDICRLKSIPTRVFHGLLDDVVPVAYPSSIYRNLKNCNSDIKLTIFDDAGHDAWSRVYDNPEIYNWLLSQTKKQK